MKALSNLKTGIFAAVFTLTATGVWAQMPSKSTWTGPTLPGDYVTFQTAGQETDTVTVGSRVAYRKNTPAAGVLTYQYKWLFTNSSDATQSWPIYDRTNIGSALTPETGTTEYYVKNDVAVDIPAALGAYKLKTAIRAVYNGTALCTPTDSISNILVVKKPKLTWGRADTAICYSTSLQDINIHKVALEGHGKWEVEYGIMATELDGTSGTVYSTLKTKSIGTPGSTDGNYLLPVAASDLTALRSAATLQTEGGVFKIQILKLTDRFSRKSLTEVEGTLPTGVGELFTIVIVPELKTKLEHIKNL
ncbi:MAG: hypothetical protein LBR08_06485 [Bacteroidales bacterium]|jgi:hypothetical protein|nr:hypothetical protein [Bacteroidales bacterium]